MPIRSINELEINGHKIGPGSPVYIIAEMSANHGRSFEQAVRILYAAKEAGANALKLQTYTPDTMTLRCDSAAFRLGDSTPWPGCTLYDLYEEAHCPWAWQPKLKSIADVVGIDLFSSAFDATAVDFLETFNVPAYKVASFEITDIPLIEKIAQTGKPIILSTGLAALSEIEEAVVAARNVGAKEIALLKCTSSYPAAPEEMNLRTIQHLRNTFKVPVGLSDHTLGIAVPVVAVAVGACIVEKHFTLSRTVAGPDSSFSLEPHEFKAMVAAIRVAEKSLGKIQYGATKLEEKNAIYRRSLYAVTKVGAGKPFTEKNVRSLRPGYGISPRYLKLVLRKRAKRDIDAGTPLKWEDVR